MSKAVRQIEVHEASINTAAVAIKTLVINGKQMTLSVFRQVEHEDIIVETDGLPVLRAEPWGKVNYFWGDMPDSAVHVLWVNNGELRRSLSRRWQDYSAKRLYDSASAKPLQFDDYSFSARAGGDFKDYLQKHGGACDVQPFVWDEPEPQRPPEPSQEPVYDGNGRRDYFARLSLDRPELQEWSSAYSDWQARKLAAWREYQRQKVTAARDILAPMRSREVRYAEAHNLLFARLQALPQLFIAV